MKSCSTKLSSKAPPRNVLHPAEQLVVHGQQPSCEPPRHQAVSPGEPDVGHPEAGLVVPLVEVQRGDVLHLDLSVSRQEATNVLIEPHLVPAAHAVDLLLLHFRLIN